MRAAAFALCAQEPTADADEEAIGEIFAYQVIAAVRIGHVALAWQGQRGPRASRVALGAFLFRS